MGRTKGTYTLTSNIEPKVGAPLDARTVVSLLTDLTANGTFDYPYIGLTVFVRENSKKYTLIGADPTVEANWREEGSGTSTSADHVTYDNTISELESTNVQDAIDEVVEGLGTAASKDYTDQVTEDSNDLITSGAVYDALENLPSNDTWRSIQVNDTEVQDGTTSSGPLKLVNGTNTSVAFDSTNKTIQVNATDTNTTYTFQGGTNSFSVTPSGGTAQTVNVTPSIADATTSTSGLMSPTDKTKLNGIASGAEVNQNAFSNVKVGSTTIESGSKTDTIELVAGSNVSLTPDTTNKKVTIAATDTNTTYTIAQGDANGQIKVTPSSGDAYNVSVKGLGSAAYKNITDTYSASGTDAVSGKAVAEALSTLPEPMVFKGTLGTGGTITTLPVDGSATIGDTYKVITAGTYDSKAAKVGDTFICKTKTSSANTWELIPSGDEPSGTVTNIATGVGLTGGPITSSGTIKAKLRSETALTNDSAAATEVAGKVYPVAQDKSGYLAVNVPWSDTNNRKSFYGICMTESATAAKEVTLQDTDGWELKAGTIVGVKFSYTNSASNCTLNVNGTGAKSIWYNNAAYTSNSAHICGNSGRMIYYMYDGSTYWIWLGTSYIIDSDTYDRVVHNGPIKCGTTAIVAGNIIVGKDGVFHQLKDGTAFDITYPILYAGNNIPANASGQNNYYIITFTVATTQSITLTAFLPVYIKGTLSGNIFTPVSTAPLTQTIPSTADGYHYILLGDAHSTTGISLYHTHPIFAYKNGAFCELVIRAAYADTAGSATDSTKVAKAGDTMSGTLRIDTTTSGSYTEGIRINKNAGNGASTLVIGASNGSTSGIEDGAWWIGTAPSFGRKLFVSHNSSTTSGTYFYASAADDVNAKLHLGTSGTIESGNGDAVHGHAVYNYIHSGKQNLDEHAANNMTANGVYYYSSNGPAQSLGATTDDGAMYVQAHSTNWVGQIAQDYRNGNLFVRGKNNGTWQAWHTVITGNKAGFARYGTTSTISNKFIKININSTLGWMLNFTVTLYQGYRPTKIMISGYQYGSNYWYSPTATLIADSDPNGSTITPGINVYFGYDSVNNLWVGFSAGNYVGVHISDVDNGYYQIENLDNLFTITIVDELTTLQTTKVAQRPNAATVNGLTVQTAVPANAVFTDTKVTQTATSTNANYEILFSATADNTTRTETAGKSSSLLYNPSTGTITANNAQATILGINSATGTTGGISLFNGTGNIDNYGICFRYTSNKGTHGNVTGDWATYFTMNNNDGRGWIFKNNGTSNVASISNKGEATFDGTLTLGKTVRKLITGTGTTAQDKGSGVSPRYYPAKWTFNLGIATPVNGEIVTIKVPVAGHDFGTFLSLDNGTTYRPISVDYGVSRLTTHYAVDRPITLIYDSTGTTNSVFAATGADSRSNISGGCWRVMNWYDTGNYYDRNRYTGTIKCGTTAIVADNIIVGKDGVYHHLKDGTAFDITYPIFYAAGAIAANSTGSNNYDVIAFGVGTTQSITLTPYLPVYIKGTLSGTIFTPVSTTPLTQTVPTTADGYYYMLLGNAYATNAIYLDVYHQIYAYQNGVFCEVPNGIPKLPVSGGDLLGGLEIKGVIAGDTGTTGHGIWGGGGYHNAYNNILLHGDSTTGSSGIAFISDKYSNGTITNINQPSDRAFIQYHAYGITTATAEATNPTLATSGESGRLVIGIGNDATDQVWLQTPGRTGLIHQVAAASYVIPDTNNTTGTVGSATQPVYVNAGAITACTYTIAKSVPSDAVFTDEKVTQTIDNATNGNFRLLLSGTADGTTRTEGAKKNDSLYYNPSNSTLSGGTSIQATNISVSASNGTSGGISLYNGAGNVDKYGIMFRKLSNKGTHGYLQTTNNWATYFTMFLDGTSERGWIFNNKDVGNVASIDTAGRAVFNGSVTIGGNTTNTSGARLEYNSVTKAIDFVFV